MAAPQTTSTADSPQDGTPGFLNQLKAATPDVLKDNAPRVVAALKICGSSSMLLSKNKVFSVAGAGFITANIISGLFGTKKSEAEKERLRNDEESQKQPASGLSSYLYKVTHPSKYPIESGSTVATAASVLWTAAGIYGNKGEVSTGRLLGGALSLASDANLALTKERFGDDQANTKEKGTLSYYATELKHRPVLVSSLLNIACDTASIAGGLHEYRKGKEINTLVAGSFLMSANLFQAIFVNKNDYNIEPAAASKVPANDSAPAKNTTWQQRVSSQPAQVAVGY